MKCYKCGKEMRDGRFVKYQIGMPVGWLPKGAYFLNFKKWKYLKQSDTSYYCENCNIVIIEYNEDEK